MQQRRLTAPQTTAQFLDAERQFADILTTPNLDLSILRHPETVESFERALATALDEAYGSQHGSDAAHLFLQRTLYRVNRLKLFWYDDLSHYDNERSSYLRSVRDRIEAPWQRWELDHFDLESLESLDVAPALANRVAEDLDPAPSISGTYFRNQVGLEGYRRLLEIVSLDALVEASQLSRTLGGAGNEIHAVMTKLLLEEYGNGKLSRKHSTYFVAMLDELGMETAPEGYFESVPWEILAAINHSFLLSERKRYYLRYVGGLLHTEVSVPAGFRNYQAAAERLGLGAGATNYWELHIREDERHGRWMLHDVAIPLAARYPVNAWEMVLGYDHQRFVSDRAGAAIARAAQAADAGARRQAETTSRISTEHKVCTA
jgi:hypothetical protein